MGSNAKMKFVLKVMWVCYRENACSSEVRAVVKGKEKQPVGTPPEESRYWMAQMSTQSGWSITGEGCHSRKLTGLGDCWVHCVGSKLLLLINRDTVYEPAFSILLSCGIYIMSDAVRK